MRQGRTTMVEDLVPWQLVSQDAADTQKYHLIPDLQYRGADLLLVQDTVEQSHLPT